MFETVLVANRGEIAVRILRTLRAMGIRSVAVFSEADANAPHVVAADEAVLLGPADAASSYLSIERVLAAAAASGAQAIHPGYGFLAENAEFASACEAAGLVFIGPTSEAIAAMGDKRAAKELAHSLGIPVVPGFHGADANDSELVGASADVGFPLLVKPAAGGGGKGMKVVREPSQLPDALASARREASAAFGDGSLLLERYVPVARHIEVQVLGDGNGKVLHLGDRECSLQRRHQKVIEEAPAPALANDVRAAMASAAVTLASAVNYRGVGTVEFILDASDGRTWFFLEMNTRLQVEHPVTELVTGLDLVELQLRVAAGEGIAFTQDDVRLSGHAVEARVCAEDGHHGFLPSSGTLVAYSEPTGVRIDSGVREGSVVSTHYDPLLLKVIAHAQSRDGALDAVSAGLSELVALGVAHNGGALRRLLADDRVRAAEMTTSLIDELEWTSAGSPLRAVAAALLVGVRREAAGESSLWGRATGWRLGAQAPALSRLVDDDGNATAVALYGRVGECRVSIDGGAPMPASLARADGGSLITVNVDGDVRRYHAVFDETGFDPCVWVGEAGDSWQYRVVAARANAGSTSCDADGEIRSPMPGSIVVLERAVGDAVSAGDVVAVVEAMKMEYPVRAPFDGVVTQLLVNKAAQVTRNQVLAVVEEL